MYFYSGLLASERGNIDVAVEGAPTEAKALISTVVENSQHFGTRSTNIYPSNSSKVNELRS